MRHRLALLGALALFAVTGCNVAKPADPVVPVELVEQPAASAGGACILWDYPFIRRTIGITFEVAASDQVDDTSTCVVQTLAGDYPTLTIAVVESTQATPKQFLAAVMPPRAVKLKGLGRAAYRLTVGSTGGHGPTIEIGWLSEAAQLQTLRFTFAKSPKKADLTLMQTKLLSLAKAMDTTN